MELLCADTRLRTATHLSVRPVEPAEHHAFLVGAAQSMAAQNLTVSFLQTPCWGEVKREWRAESLGWFAGSHLVGSALVLYRDIPYIGRSLAYVPEGPVIDWYSQSTGYGLADWLDPLVERLRQQGAFTVKLGPKLAVRGWTAATVKKAVAEGRHRRLGQVPADWCDLRAEAVADRLRGLGWRREERPRTEFADYQPRYRFRVPLRGRCEGQVLADANQQWRRNIRIAQRSGVEVVRGDFDDLARFHGLYLQTAARDGFSPRPLDYFEQLWSTFSTGDPDGIRLYLARVGGRDLAAATMSRFGGYAWYSYGASADQGREVRPCNALQWRMVQDCIADGMDFYDLRGVSDLLDPQLPLYGLLRFKMGLGGEAVEYLGEWDYPINRPLHKAFHLYLSRR